MGCGQSRGNPPAVKNSDKRTAPLKSETMKFGDRQEHRPDLSSGSDGSEDTPDRMDVYRKGFTQITTVVKLEGRTSSIENSPATMSATESVESQDSGVGDCSRSVLNGVSSNTYENIITEDSEFELVHMVERNFHTPTDGLTDLEITGIRPPRHMSARDKQRLEEQSIIESLRNEGLITKKTSQTKTGVTFEITEVFDRNRRKPPPRLEKLETKQPNITERDIKDKLDKAEIRRKEYEERKQRSASARKRREDVHQNKENLEKKEQQSTQMKCEEKLGKAAEAREHQQTEREEKWKLERDKAEQARLRRMLTLSPVGNESDMEREMELWKEKERVEGTLSVEKLN